MTDESTGAEDAKNAASEPKMVELELDGRKITVQEDHAEILKQKEHDLSSRNERILAEERQKLADQSVLDKANFEKDVKAYDDIVKKGGDLSKYDSVYLGGTGKYFGDYRDDNTDDDTVTRQTNATKPPETFVSNEITELRNEVAALKTSLADDEKGKARELVDYMENLQKSRYDFADADAVLIDMNAYRDKYQRHPSEKAITDMLKRRHDNMVDKIKKSGGTVAQPRTTQTIPDTRNARPPKSIPAKELPRLDDQEAWAALINDDMGQQE